jgi:hypothetical protein
MALREIYYMKPISNLNFGAAPGKIAITYHDGVGVVTGYIVKQIGLMRYIASVDGVATSVVTLAQTTAEAEALVAGKATITVTPFEGDAEFVRNLQSVTCVTTEGNRFSWLPGPATSVGFAEIATIAEAAPEGPGEE